MLPASEREQPPNAFQPLRTQRLFESVVEQIRDAIFSGRLRPGDRLPAEVELARQFAVSRAAIREAVRVLELTGLLTVRAGAGGGIVVSDTVNQMLGGVFETMYRLEQFGLEDFYQARRVFEAALAEAAAESATLEDLHLLEESISEERLEQPAAFQQARSFHQLVAAATHNALLESVGLAIRELSDRLRIPTRGAPEVYSIAQADHGSILRALRDRDPALARLRMAEHLKRIEPLFSTEE